MNELFLKLDAVFGVNSKGLLEKYLWTEYSNMKFIEGTYTYAVFEEPAIRNVLRENILNKVYFAGEATNSKYFATVHGALDSGI
jgi:nicotinamidase-related amidase